MSIGIRIKEKRIEQKLTQPQLANEIGVSLDMIKSIEINRVNPSVDTLKKLSGLFNCSADYLLGNETLLKTQLLKEFNRLSEDDQQRAIEIIRKISQRE